MTKKKGKAGSVTTKMVREKSDFVIEPPLSLRDCSGDEKQIINGFRNQCTTLRDTQERIYNQYKQSYRNSRNKKFYNLNGDYIKPILTKDVKQLLCRYGCDNFWPIVHSSEF